jgi:hypothetical protein
MVKKISKRKGPKAFFEQSLVEKVVGAQSPLTERVIFSEK